MELIKTLEAVLFDLDGTLVRTEFAYMKKELAKILDHFKIPYDDKLIRKLWFDDNRSKIIAKKGVDPKLFWRTYNELEDTSSRHRYINLYDADDPEFVDYKINDSRFKKGYSIINRLELNGRKNFNLWMDKIGFLSPKHLRKIKV